MYFNGNVHNAKPTPPTTPNKISRPINPISSGTLSFGSPVIKSIFVNANYTHKPFNIIQRISSNVPLAINDAGIPFFFPNPDSKSFINIGTITDTDTQDNV